MVYLIGISILKDIPYLCTNGMVSLFFLDSSLCNGSMEESDLLKRQRSLYIDLGALAGYFNIVRGPPALEYD